MNACTQSTGLTNISGCGATRCFKSSSLPSYFGDRVCSQEHKNECISDQRVSSTLIVPYSWVPQVWPASQHMLMVAWPKWQSCNTANHTGAVSQCEKNVLEHAITHLTHPASRAFVKIAFCFETTRGAQECFAWLEVRAVCTVLL